MIVLGWSFGDVMYILGYIIGVVVYVIDGKVFMGDMFFYVGCGCFFEGMFVMMFEFLVVKLKGCLVFEILVYLGYEYMVNNF